MHGYRVERTLQADAHGEVLLARENGLRQRLVVVRRAREHARLVEQARAASFIVHPHVVTVLEIGGDDAGPFIVLEHVQGSSLALLIGRQPVPIEACVRAAHDAAAALHAAHVRGVVHGEVTPSSFVISKDGRAHLIDLVGGGSGDLAYLAPEQIEGGDVVAATDQFALGVVLWESIAGRKMSRARDRVLEGRVPVLSSVRAGVPNALDLAVQRMLRPRPEQRFASCADAAQALSEAVRLDRGQAALAVALRSLVKDRGTPAASLVPLMVDPDDELSSAPTRLARLSNIEATKLERRRRADEFDIAPTIVDQLAPMAAVWNEASAAIEAAHVPQRTLARAHGSRWAASFLVFALVLLVDDQLLARTRVIGDGVAHIEGWLATWR